MFALKKTHCRRILKHAFYSGTRFVSNLNLWNEEISSEIKHKIENHWRNMIPVVNFNDNDNATEKYYVLSMFPYPSGSLHMGHVRVYTISDTIARYQRMNGKNVIHPIGWDAFGLPAENAAIERNISPHEWTQENIKYMKQQLQHLGCSFDWDREIATCDPVYYKWTQFLFLKLYEAGLVYQNEAMVNWDPVDKTVLADEQVDDQGCSWRSGAKVEKKFFKQWFIRTTKFAKDLYNGLDNSVLQDWRDIIKLQRNWIGECNGINLDFKVVNDADQIVTLWTPEPEYVEYAKFVAVTTNHILAKKENVSKTTGTLKLKVELNNPLVSGNIPVFVTDEIQFLDLTDSYLGIPGISEQATTFAAKHHICCDKIPAIESSDLYQKRQMVSNKAKQLNVGGFWTSARLKDWLISRQRYWGTPIPIVYCKKCGVQPVPQELLPVVLPKLAMSQKGGGQLSQVADWINTTCPKCEGPAKRETDTMDTFVDSSWYFLRYVDPKNRNKIFDKQKADRMTPVDLYIGGKEHAVLHLYYARFMNHFLHSLGLLSEREPFKRLLVQGMVMGRSFRVKGTGKYLPENKVDIIDLKKNKAVAKETGEPVTISWDKMSKSKHNGVDPKDMFQEYGVDTTRLLILGNVAPMSHRNWNKDTFPGILTWQKRLWLTVGEFLKHRKNLPPMIPSDQFASQNDFMFDSRNFYIKGTSFHYVVTQQLSVAISKQQGLTNSLRKCVPAVFAHSLHFERALASQIIMLAPMAPMFASELWAGFVSAPNRLNKSQEIDWDKTVLEQRWPEIDMNYKLELVCQVNGHDNCALKYERSLLENMMKTEAVEIALQQKEVQVNLINRNILDVSFSINKGFGNIVNILTDKPPAKPKAETVQDLS